MQDETLNQPLPLPRPRRTLGATLAVALLAFLLGGGAVAWLAGSGRLAYALPGSTKPSPPAAPAPVVVQPVMAPAAATGGDATSLSGVETRLALLEERLTRVGGDAGAAAGNAARAEALLIASAARRRIDRGAPLEVVASQLQLRFGGAQPQAVQTVIRAAEKPITMDELSGQLDAIAPTLIGAVREEGAWARMQREVASLFVVRRAPASAATPANRIAKVHLMLASGRVEEAIAEVERMPGADGAQEWIATARRYAETQRALDVIETAAMLEPRALHDGAGKPVEQPSPLAPGVEVAPQVVLPEAPQ